MQAFKWFPNDLELQNCCWTGRSYLPTNSNKSAGYKIKT